MLSNFKFARWAIAGILCLCTALIWSCQKNSETQLEKISKSLGFSVHQNKLLVSEVQKAYETQNIFPQLKETFQDSLTVYWMPVWKSTSSVSREGINYYYVPLKPLLLVAGRLTAKKFYATGFEKILIATIDSNSKVKFMLAKYEQAASKKNQRINFEQFSGMLLLSDFKNTTGYIYKNNVGSKWHQVNNSPTGRIVCDMECTWSRWCERGLTVTYTIGYLGATCPPPAFGMEEIDCGGSVGTSGAWEPGLSSLFNCHQDDPTLPPIPPNGNPNGEGPVYGTAAIMGMSENFTTPCFKAVYNDIKNNTNAVLPNKVMDMMNNFFSFNTKVNLHFTEQRFLTIAGTEDKSVDGAMTFSIQPTGTLDIYVVLNTNAMEHSSKQYIAGTMMHEIGHGFMTANGIPEAFQHNEMGFDYVNEMGKALYSAYPVDMSLTQAFYLAWGGLQNSYSWTLINPSIKRDIILTNDYFKNGPFGTYCK